MLAERLECPFILSLFRSTPFKYLSRDLMIQWTNFLHISVDKLVSEPPQQSYVSNYEATNFYMRYCYNFLFYIVALGWQIGTAHQQFQTEGEFQSN
jgi:hypothetical protein